MPNHRAAMLLAFLVIGGCGGGTRATPEQTPAAVTTPAAPPNPATAEPNDTAPTAGPEAPSGAAGPTIDASCVTDAECELSTFPGCCACCTCAPLYAARAQALREAESLCARARCDRGPCNPADCSPCASIPAGVRAVCRAGTCAIRP